MAKQSATSQFNRGGQRKMQPLRPDWRLLSQVILTPGITSPKRERLPHLRFSTRKKVSPSRVWNCDVKLRVEEDTEKTHSSGFSGVLRGIPKISKYFDPVPQD